MEQINLTDAQWRKASKSNGQGGACVEVATVGGRVAVRDSKNPNGGVLLFTPNQWTTFLNDIRRGEFTLP